MSTTTSADGTKLHLEVWAPEAEPIGDILLVHGLAEHMGRYGHVAAVFTDAGYRVTGLELRGHGHSGGKRGHVDSWSQYSEDLYAAQEYIDAEHTIVAHSMGGLVTLDAMRLKTSPQVKGLIISNPLLGAKVKAPQIKIKIGRLLSRILPRFPLKNEIPTDHICRDKEVVRKYEADPMVYSTITPRWFTEMEQAQLRVWQEAGRATLPLLMLLGDSDLICDAEKSGYFMDRWGGEGETERYPALVHELFNEPEKDEVLARALGWVQQRAG